MAEEIGELDLTAQANAAQTATSYITAVDENGITVHPAQSNWSTTGGRTNINSTGMTVYVGSDDVAFYGATARIGKSNSDRVTVDSTNGITIYKGNSKRLQTTANGIDVYGSDGSTSIASFGSSARIGKEDSAHFNVLSGSIVGYSSTDVPFFNVSLDGGSVKTPIEGQVVNRNVGYPHGTTRTLSSNGSYTIQLPFNKQPASGSKIYIPANMRTNAIMSLCDDTISRITYGTPTNQTHCVALFNATGRTLRVFQKDTLTFNYGTAGSQTISATIPASIAGGTNNNLVVSLTVEYDPTIGNYGGIRYTWNNSFSISAYNDQNYYNQFVFYHDPYIYEVTTPAPSMTFGLDNASSGGYSSAFGLTQARGEHQTTVGKYNDNDSDNAFEIGNGTSPSDTSNAFSVGWDGTVNIAKPLPKESGGTGQTGIARSTVTLSGCTVSGQRCWHNGVTCSVTMIDVKLSSALGNGNSVAFGTIPSGYRPSEILYDVASSPNATFCGRLVFRIDQNGQLSIVNRSGSNLPANTAFSLFVTYAI